MPRPTPLVNRVRWRHHSLGFWTKESTAGVHDQLLPERGRHLPEGKPALISPPVNSHALHPGQTPVADASRYYLLLIMDPSLSFHKHCNYVTDRINKRNNMLKALAGSFWGQANDTSLLTYNALGKSIASYAAPVWSTNATDSSLKKIQTTQNVALTTAAGSRKMASIDHLHQESLTLKVNDHSDMLSAQYLVNCLEEGHVCHGSRTQEPKPKPRKKTLHSRHHPTVLPRLGASRKERPPPNIRRGAETEPKTTIHSLTATIRTLPSTVGLQALGVVVVVVCHDQVRLQVSQGFRCRDS